MPDQALPGVRTLHTLRPLCRASVLLGTTAGSGASDPRSNDWLARAWECRL